MRKRFSERNGFVEVRDTFQMESMNEDLKNRLWNKFRTFYIEGIKLECSQPQDFIYMAPKDYDFFIQVYDEFFKSSTKPTNHMISLLYELEKLWFNMNWYEIYDFIEYISDTYHKQDINIQFKQTVNQVLEAEMSGYRFAGSYIAPVINNIEIKELEEALECKYTPVKQHLSNALELLSDRKNPDYQNSIKESITAVESVAKIITGKETDLGSCLKVMNLDLNKQFRTSMTSLYGWTCKEDGIRHGNTQEELKTSFEEAKYMLVSCSAFVNYLISKNKD